MPPAAARWLVDLHAVYVPQAVTLILVVIALAVEWSVRDLRRKAILNVALAVVVFILLAFSIFAFWTPLQTLFTNR